MWLPKTGDPLIYMATKAGVPVVVQLNYNNISLKL